jgi:hypothetical protein
MAEKNKNIDDLFRDSLGDYTEVPDPSVWSDIERKLDAGNSRTGGTAGTGSGRRLFFWLVAGVALFFTAKWAISRFADTRPVNAIAITNESANHIPITPSANSSLTPANNSGRNINIDSTTNASVIPNVNAPIHLKSESSHTHSVSKTNTIQESHQATHKYVAAVGPPAMLSSLAPQLPVVTKNEIPAQNNFIFEKEYIDALSPNSAFHLLANKADEETEFALRDVDLERLIKRIQKNLSSGGLQGGIKLGFETGFNAYTAAKLVVSPYIQYNVSPKFSVLLQPGLKFTHLTNNDLVSPNSYYNITNSAVTTGHTVQKGDSILGAPDTIIRRYYYKQASDSILIGFNAAKRNYIEFELPILLQYRMTTKLSVFGGINFNFGKVLQLKENRETYSVVRMDSIIYPATLASNAAPTPPAIDSLFTHTAKPYASYSSNNNLNPSGEPMRVSYMLGVSYNVRERWMIDLLMQQTFTSVNYIPNDKIKAIYKQPYFRVSIGYRLFKSGTRHQNKK